MTSIFLASLLVSFGIAVGTQIDFYISLAMLGIALVLGLLTSRRFIPFMVGLYGLSLEQPLSGFEWSQVGQGIGLINTPLAKFALMVLVLGMFFQRPKNSISILIFFIISITILGLSIIKYDLTTPFYNLAFVSSLAFTKVRKIDVTFLVLVIKLCLLIITFRLIVKIYLGDLGLIRTFGQVAWLAVASGILALHFFQTRPNQSRFTSFLVRPLELITLLPEGKGTILWLLQYAYFRVFFAVLGIAAIVIYGLNNPYIYLKFTEILDLFISQSLINGSDAGSLGVRSGELVLLFERLTGNIGNLVSPYFFDPISISEVRSTTGRVFYFDYSPIEFRKDLVVNLHGGVQNWGYYLGLTGILFYAWSILKFSNIFGLMKMGKLARVMIFGLLSLTLFKTVGFALFLKSIQSLYDENY